MDASYFATWAEFEEQMTTRLAELRQAFGERRMIALLIGKDTTDLMKSKIIPAIAYLNAESADAIDFYLIGWTKTEEAGGYYPGGMGIPDPAKGIKRNFYFHADRFVKTMDVLRRHFDWTYSGELDMILFEGILVEGGVELDFSNALVVQMTFREKDGSIKSVDGFIQGIIDFAKTTKSDSPIRTYVTRRLTNIAMAGLYDGILGLFPKEMQRFIKNITHIFPKDLTSTESKIIKIEKHEMSKGFRV